MSDLHIGPIEILIGENQSRTPFSTSLLIKGKESDAFIDCGAGEAVFDYVKREHNVQDIYVTHYHLDHIWGLAEFPESLVWINERDLPKFSDLDEIAKANGYFAIYGEEEGKEWVRGLREEAGARKRGHYSWSSVIGARKAIYPYDREIELAGTRVVMLHAPGHCEGFCCPYFPDYGILHVGDFDLTAFGPWYNNADSDIDDMVLSAKQTLLVDAELYVTSHQKGVVSRADYQRLLETYMGIIDRREEKVNRAVRQGMPPEQLIHQEVFYLQKNVQQTPRLLVFEKMGIAKHLRRLIKHGEPIQDYYESYLTAHGMHGEFVDYVHTPSAATPSGVGELNRPSKGERK
ncbi:MBL fold metallo-hydrolase [Brevibacillus invocatus]|uniref:MBL fold metallo-hydrolase n=1 Tax=Brevibacillus invocatus TaxID=173959 RepID=A0A3M8C7A0_9BACL|nr:MBL fold metallo-hydrolase [Brevibacillus invocatus]RNB71580.1 MBL fold metallo-hydrolase [Brevibacillus invocatus]